MAYETKLGFEGHNDTVKALSLNTYQLGLKSNYGKIEDEPDRCVITNGQTSTDTPEFITFRCKDIDKLNTRLKPQNPNKVQAYQQYSVTVEDIARATDSVTGNVIDEPVVCQVILRHNKNALISDDIVNKMIARAMSATVTFSDHPEATGYAVASNWGSIRRNILEPTRN